MSLITARLTIFVFAFFQVTVAFAASEGAHHGAEGGIPNVVWWQIFNFAIFAGGLFFLLRKKVANYFSERAAHFEQALVKAEKARAEAESQKRAVEARLMALQSNADQSVAQARAEAEELRARIVREAQDLSARLQEDAKRTTEIEIQRAKAELREEVLAQAVLAAKQILSEKIAETDQKRLQSEFVEKIQVVR